MPPTRRISAEVLRPSGKERLVALLRWATPERSKPLEKRVQIGGNFEPVVGIVDLILDQLLQLLPECVPARLAGDDLRCAARQAEGKVEADEHAPALGNGILQKPDDIFPRLHARLGVLHPL